MNPDGLSAEASCCGQWPMPGSAKKRSVWTCCYRRAPLWRLRVPPIRNTNSAFSTCGVLPEIGASQERGPCLCHSVAEFTDPGGGYGGHLQGNRLRLHARQCASGTCTQSVKFQHSARRTNRHGRSGQIDYNGGSAETSCPEAHAKACALSTFAPDDLPSARQAATP